jgi:hypothetical protein
MKKKVSMYTLSEDLRSYTEDCLSRAEQGLYDSPHSQQLRLVRGALEEILSFHVARVVTNKLSMIDLMRERDDPADWDFCYEVYHKFGSKLPLVLEKGYLFIVTDDD